MPPQILKQPCEEIAVELIRKAENLGRFRKVVEQMEERLNEDLKRGAFGPLIEDRKRMLKDRQDQLDHEEAQILDLIVKVVKCEQG